jgi:hypothetical protein
MPSVSGPHRHCFAETVPLCLYATIAICAQLLSLQAHACLCALAIFPANPQSFSEEAALAMSQQSRRTLDVLCDVGLLENYGHRRYSLHQTIADYARAKITYMTTAFIVLLLQPCHLAVTVMSLSRPLVVP